MRPPSELVARMGQDEIRRDPSDPRAFTLFTLGTVAQVDCWGITELDDVIGRHYFIDGHETNPLWLPQDRIEAFTCQLVDETQGSHFTQLTLQPASDSTFDVWVGTVISTDDQ